MMKEDDAYICTMRIYRPARGSTHAITLDNSCKGIFVHGYEKYSSWELAKREQRMKPLKRRFGINLNNISLNN